MSALLCDPVTGDIVITNNKFTLIDGPQQIRQSLASRIRTFLGEWFLDLTFGTPWLQQILVKNTANAEAAIKAIIIGTKGVLAINSFSMTVNAVERSATVLFNVQVQTGPLPGQVEFSF